MEKSDYADLVNLLNLLRRYIKDEPSSMVRAHHIQTWIDRWLDKLNSEWPKDTKG